MPPKLRTVIISKALSVSCSARTDSAATMKAVSTPLIQNTSQPSWALASTRAGSVTDAPSGVATSPVPLAGRLKSAISTL
jgi:hypothetical protein